MNRGYRWLFIIGGILLAVLIIASLFGGGYYNYGPGGWIGPGMMGPGMMGGGWGGYGGNYGGGFGTGWLTTLITIVFFGLIIAAVVVLVRAVTRGAKFQPVSGRADAALEILNNRYAKGEIKKEEYEQKRKDLI